MRSADMAAGRMELRNPWANNHAVGPATPPPHIFCSSTPPAPPTFRRSNRCRAIKVVMEQEGIAVRIRRAGARPGFTASHLSARTAVTHSSVASLSPPQQIACPFRHPTLLPTYPPYSHRHHPNVTRLGAPV
ncbi:hypothetical protein SKAU_G00429570 [Synaphobranchus kaupii]|uniref:Uncharacterized protein n=1 Tax=Synaphobranchus kaupii TaxID=118154 RepID=A0A9Q1E4J2_SYNKA|nr:hypothetical protein SKAU_G00429570 [Synaphobranchus kaupii]